jgi:proline racemase
MHTCGEPLRVFTSGLPPLEGRTVLEKRRYFREHHDRLRTALLWEPRGHADMYGAVVTRSEDADFDVFFLHNEGYSTMCGHAIIALTTLAIDTALLPPPRLQGSEVEVTFNVPAGRISARGKLHQGRACEVSFRNVPSFVYMSGREIAVPGIGAVRFDIAYGGAFYALIPASALGLELSAQSSSRLIDYGRRIKRAVMAAFPIEHPLEPELSFLYGTIFTAPPQRSAHHSRNVCVFADGELDRSPTGSGLSARAALHFATGELRLSETITIESILGCTMTVRAAEQTKVGAHDAIIPEVGGSAFITGRHEFYLDPADPLRNGFFIR